MDGRKLAVFCLLLSQCCLAAAMRHLIYWDKKKIPALAKDGLELTVEVDDWMDALCPYFANRDSSHRVRDQTVFFFVYNVTESDFLNCDVRRGRKVQDCDHPFTESKMTTKFQERSPSPHGFVFKPDSTYYYISKPIHGGSNTGCAESTLKMAVHVKKKGTVHARSDQSTIKFYHEVVRKLPETTFPAATTAPSGHSKHPRRHHRHHDHAKLQTTPLPKPVFKDAPSPRGADGGAEASRNVQDDDGPKNGGRGSMRSPRAFAFAVGALASSLVVAFAYAS